MPCFMKEFMSLIVIIYEYLKHSSSSSQIKYAWHYT
jgi:hypothetical protein